MRTNFDDFEAAPLQRPTFLTVLCILTFIGSGISILSSVGAYFRAEKTVSAINVKMLDKTSDSLSYRDSVRMQKRKNNTSYLIGKKIGASAKKMLTVDNIHKLSIGDFVAALFTLSGAILMWFRKRRGFYLYIVGVVIAIALPFYLYGNDLLTVGMASFGAFFGLVFIALYALNLKWMGEGGHENL